MNFNQLRAIIKNIRSQVRCPSCEGAYTSEDLSVVSAVQNRCILVAQCKECAVPILVTATLSPAGEKSSSGNEDVLTEHRMLQEIRSEEIISADDVLDMHQFLKSFTGDISGIVSKPTRKAE